MDRLRRVAREVSHAWSDEPADASVSGRDDQGALAEFRGVFSRETVARCVEESYEQIGERPTVGPNFMPVIIERFARERL